MYSSIYKYSIFIFYMYYNIITKYFKIVYCALMKIQKLLYVQLNIELFLLIKIYFYQIFFHKKL